MLQFSLKTDPPETLAMPQITERAPIFFFFILLLQQRGG